MGSLFMVAGEPRIEKWGRWSDIIIFHAEQSITEKLDRPLRPVPSDGIGAGVDDSPLPASSPGRDGRGPGRPAAIHRLPAAAAGNRRGRPSEASRSCSPAAGPEGEAAPSPAEGTHGARSRSAGQPRTSPREGVPRPPAEEGNRPARRERADPGRPRGGTVAEHRAPSAGAFRAAFPPRAQVPPGAHPLPAKNGHGGS